MSNDDLDHALAFIDSWLSFRYNQEDFPGYTVAVSHKGNILFNKSFGYADMENHNLLTPQHIFRVASHSKTFTTTALMQLQEQGKLRIDDYVIQYLPWLKEHKDERWQRVTIRQLLSHGAGVIRDGLDADYWQLERPFPSEQELRAEILAASLVIENNTKLKYSNFGYSLLGLLVESVSGEPYNTYVIENIVKPLHLKSTGPEYTAAVAARLVTGYTRRDVNRTRLPIAQIDTRAMSAATGFYATAEDLCLYFTAQMIGSGKLLSDESKKEMQRVQWHAFFPNKQIHVDYGLGLNLEYVANRPTMGHGGGFPGQITRSVADLKNELVVVACTNCMDGAARQMVKGIYTILDYFQQHAPSTKPEHHMSNLEGRYMNLWGTTNIVVTGDKIVGTYPDTWEPLSDPEELTYVNDTTFRIGNTNSFNSGNELVRFKLRDGKVESVNYGGATMWPEVEWIKRLSAKKSIDLPEA